MANYESSVVLPSNQQLYSEEDGIPKALTLRAMTTREEKIVFGSNGSNVIDEVLKECIKEPIDIKKLVSQDKMDLLIQLRILSYGSDYHINSTCPECGSTDEYKIDLNKLSTDKLTAKLYKECTNLTLPRSADKVTIKLLNGYDEEKLSEDIEKQLKIARKNGITVTYDDAEFEHENASRLVSVNGKELTDVEKQKYFDEMQAMDSAYIRSKISKLMFGIDSSVELQCSTCGAKFEGAYQMSPEFFRPRFD